MSDDMTTEPDPFDQYSIPEVCAFIHKKCGPDALRELLARPIKAADGKANLVHSKEDWLDISAELRGAGLNAVAAVVDEFAAAALPMTDWSFCPYTPDAGRANRESWLRSEERRQAIRAEKRERWSLPPRVKDRKPKPTP